MKSKYLIGLLALLACGFYAAAQQPDISDPLAQQPMTVVERQLINTADISEIQQIYDTLKTDYERRNFIHALPRYFSMKNITSVPAWVDNAVLTALTSNEPFYVAEAVRTAGVLKINCSQVLMNLYRSVHAKYGCNEELLKSYILNSLRCIQDPGNHQFFYEVLTADNMPLLSAQFEALLYALEKNRKMDVKSNVYNIKLAECSSKINSLKIQFQTDKKHGYGYRRASEILKKIEALREGIAKDQAMLIQGGNK
jgi:hypothetical protein